MICAVTYRESLNFMVFKGRFNNHAFLEFLDRLLRQTQNPVFLILDKHRVHRSKEVGKWIKEHEGRIRLFFRKRSRMPHGDE